MEIFNNIICDSVRAIFKEWAIFTDDGHGWFTMGKRSFTDPVFHENEFNSVLEAKLMLLFDHCGIEYYQISPGSIDTELWRRERYENELVADLKTRGKRALGISIHCDAYIDPKKPDEQNSAHGFCVYYYKRGKQFSEEGKKLARFIAESIKESDQENGHIISPRHDDGISGSNFLMLRETHATWVLIESAFMTNDNDLYWLRNDGFRNDRVLAIFTGLYNYAKS